MILRGSASPLNWLSNRSVPDLFQPGLPCGEGRGVVEFAVDGIGEGGHLEVEGCASLIGKELSHCCCILDSPRIGHKSEQIVQRIVEDG